MTGRLLGATACCALCGLLVVGRAAAAAPGGTAPPATPGPARRPSRPGTAPAPRAYLIYLIDGSDPIVVKRYVEEGDQIRFEKYGGWISFPRYEVQKIVPDEPDTTANVPPAPAPSADAGPGPAPVAAGATDSLYVTTRDGASVKASAVRAEGERLRITVPDGSFTLPRADVVGIVRVPKSPQSPEAWLTVLSTEAVGVDGMAAPAGAASPRADPDRPPAGTASRPSSPPNPGPPVLVSSDKPHLLRLASGQTLHVDGFWVEGNEIRFRRMGGMVGMALSEVARLIPEQLAPANGRTAFRYGQQVGPDRLEVQVKTGAQRVRLIGLEPVPGARAAEDPWRSLSRGLVVYLEFDRQRYDRQGDWLAYVFMPNGRMLNAELIRLGLAHPRLDGRNVRYLDLFQEIAVADAN